MLGALTNVCATPFRDRKKPCHEMALHVGEMFNEQESGMICFAESGTAACYARSG